MLQELSPGSVVSERFQIERMAGSGGMGAVYRAVDRQTQQPVAVKVLFDGADKARFHREALLLAELSHPGIVSYVAHGHTDGGHPFLAMQWLPGHDLAERLRHGGLNLKEALHLARRVAEALSVAHGRGVVHRDIKPSNLFLVDGDPGKVVLLDFGIARRGFGGRSAAMTQTGTIVGTPEYMAPEQARGQSQLSPAADVFSLGCVLHECLTGRPPFVAAHVAAVLAKILFEEAPPLRSLRPELPPSLELLLASMLRKDSTKRPQGGGAVLSELLSLPELPTLQGPGSERSVVAPSIRQSEQQLVSVLLVSEVTEVSALATMAQADDAVQKARLETLRTHLAPSGLLLERLADGSLLGTLHQLGSGAATDLAGRAARAALHIHERWGEAVVAIATGKGMLDGDVPVGEAVDRAALLLRQRTTGGGPHSVLLDELTAGLLDTRFEVTRLYHGAYALRGERLTIDESRKLLGKPTPCVGREQELLALSAVLSTCIEESTPRVALVVAPAGVGKSRLRHEFVRRTAAGPTPVEVLFGRGDAMNPGAPYGLWASVLRGLSGRLDGKKPQEAWAHLLQRATDCVGEAEAARVAAFLAELAGLSPSVDKYPPLHAARSDGRLFFEQATQAVTDFLRGACQLQPILLVLEDLQWGDPQSIELTEAALRALPESPFMVLALARPEFESRLPKLGKDRGLQEIYLGGLGKRASERLVQSILGAQVAARSVQRIVEQSAGNALYLEELIRAFAEGKTEQLPGTVLAMLQARIGRLTTEQRRVLRVASIFGDTFYRGGVLQLLGHGSAGGSGGDHIDQVLRELTDAEIIERHRDSRLPGEVEYVIRHSLLREAAYSLLTDDDRQLGHRLCAEFLRQGGEADHAVLARHFELGSDLPAAVKHYIEAASDTWNRGGLEHAEQLCEAALRCGASGELLGAVRCVQAQLRLFNNQLAAGLQYAREGLSLSPPGGRFYYWSLLGLLASATLLGRMEVVMEVLRDFDGRLPHHDAAGYFQEFASLIGQLYVFLAMRDKARQALGQMRAVCDLFEGDPQWPLFHASWQRAQASFDMYLGDNPYQAQAMLLESSATYLRFGQLRFGVLALLDAAMNAVPLGDSAQALQLGQQGAVLAAQLGDSHMRTFAEIVICGGRILAEDASALDTVQHRLREILASAGDDQIQRGQVLSLLAASHFHRQEWALAAEKFAESVEVLQMLPAVVPYSYASLAAAQLQLGQLAEAAQTAELGLITMSLLEHRGPYAASVWQVQAEVAQALGNDEGARVALRRAVDI
nr:protein kinase [Deltaproteobacteria bacterium]